MAILAIVSVSVLGYLAGAVVTFLCCQFKLAERDAQLSFLGTERNKIPDDKHQEKRDIENKIYRLEKSGKWLVFPLWEKDGYHGGSIEKYIWQHTFFWPFAIVATLIVTPFWLIVVGCMKADAFTKAKFHDMAVNRLKKKEESPPALASKKDATQAMFREPAKGCDSCGAAKEAWTK